MSAINKDYRVGLFNDTYLKNRDFLDGILIDDNDLCARRAMSDCDAIMKSAVELSIGQGAYFPRRDDSDLP
jgi:hypothetical protein